MRLVSWLRSATSAAVVLSSLSSSVSAGKVAGAATCGVLSTTNVLLYADAANGADPLWFQDMLNWWKTANPTLNIQSLPASQISSCNLAAMNNLRIFIHPGGNAYNSLSALGASGVAAIRAYIYRNQQYQSAYVGACSGAYSSGHDYLWSTMYEGTSYYNFATSPPYSFNPHTSEGPIVDISDSQWGSYETNGVQPWRVVTTSNGHRMIYWGGPTYGYNAVPNYGDPSSPEYDPALTPLLYFKDFYGYKTANLLAAWTYKLPNFGRANVLATSVHPEASQVACSNDCLPANVLTDNEIKANWAWFLTYMNQVADTPYWVIPSANVAPVFNTAPPHIDYPTLSCATGAVLFCDDFSFTNTPGSSYPGMYQWQRNQTEYDASRPWNVTFTGTMMGQTAGYYGVGASGATDGWAVVVPGSSTLAPEPTITSRQFSTVGKNTVTLQYKYKGQTTKFGFIKSQVTTNSGASWTDLHSQALNPAITTWTSRSAALPIGQTNVQIRFACSSGLELTNYCGIDEVKVVYT